MVEVNASPGLRMHLAPAVGEPRPVGEAIVDMMFAPGDNGRIPIAAITGTNGKTTVARFLAHLLQQPGRCVGMTCTDGVYVNDRRIITGDCSGPISARNLLMHPLVDVAVLETARGGILRAGVAFNECQVAIVTNVGEGDLKEFLVKTVPLNAANLKNGLIAIVGLDGYRSVYTVSEIMNRNDQAEVLLVPCPDEKDGGMFRIFPSCDFFSDRAVKAVTEIHFN